MSTTLIPTTIRTTGPVDTTVMLVVHSMFRREVRLAADVVRRVQPGDTGRSTVVGSHLELIGRALHHHHATEDELLWPLLLERVPDEMAPVVTSMQSQHARVDALLRQIGPRRIRWAATADATDRDALAALYDELSSALVEHLDDEEAHLLPLAAACLTQAEWDAIGAVGRAGPERSERTLVLGMMMYDGDPEVVAMMLGSAPAPVRAVITRLARRAYRRYATAVHGTATP